VHHKLLVHNVRMATLPAVSPEDPASLGYPPTFPIELALRTAPVKDICEAYGFEKADWDRIRRDPVFLADLRHAVEAVKKDGMSFKLKARLQSEELLKKSWSMIHASPDVVPPSVQADLIKFTIRAAGLDGSKDQASQSIGTALQINIQL